VKVEDHDVFHIDVLRPVVWMESTEMALIDDVEAVVMVVDASWAIFVDTYWEMVEVALTVIFEDASLGTESPV
jgi:hypothetical protein